MRAIPWDGGTLAAIITSQRIATALGVSGRIADRMGKCGLAGFRGKL